MDRTSATTNHRMHRIDCVVVWETYRGGCRSCAFCIDFSSIAACHSSKVLNPDPLLMKKVSPKDAMDTLDVLDAERVERDVWMGAGSDSQSESDCNSAVLV